MACTTNHVSRYSMYASTSSGTTQYFTFTCCENVKLCDLYNTPLILLKAVSTGATSTDTVSVACSCGGVLPLMAASTMAAVTVAQVPSGTVLAVSVTRTGGVPQGIVLGL